MAKNPFDQFDASTANPFDQFDVPVAAPQEIPGPRQTPGFLTQLGRGAASLADVTIGGILPAVAQQLAYPVARLGRTPRQAQAATERVVSAIDKPFGKAFGVTETPEYQQEAGRQLMDFIGQNFQKGAKWIASNTGLPQSDVENMMGSASFAAPALAKPIAQVTRETIAPGVKMAASDVSEAVKKPFAQQIQARRERQSAKDYERGPQIDAASEAKRLGIALNPVDIEPSRGSKAISMIAGARGPEALTEVNRGQVRKVALNELNLPETTQLDTTTAFDQARSQVAKPYEEVAKLPIQVADDAMVKRLDALKADLDVIGASDYAPAISKIVDDAISKTQTGLTGEQLLKNIRVLRERARKTYNSKSASIEALDIADTNLKIATELESLIENSITNPKLLGQFRDARQKMARSYAYEGATDLNTGMVDVKKLARITSTVNNLTGDIAALGKIAGNFPDVFSTKAPSKWYSAPRASRSGLAGGAGAYIGSQFGGLEGAIMGGALGGLVGEGAGYLAARRMASPEYQAGLNLRDMRIPVNQLAAPIPRENALVPYETEIVGPSGTGDASKLRIVSYDENGVPIYMAEERGQGFTMPGEPRFDIPTPFAQRSLPNEVPRQIYEAQKRAELAQEFKAAAERKPARGGILYDFDPITGQLREVSSTLKGATPDIQIIESTGKALQSASEKLASGKSPALMSAEERIAWNKTKVDLATVAPDLKGLSDKAIAAKMMDREWVNNAIAKARQQAAAFDAIAQRAKTAQASREAAIKREKMLDMLADLEDSLRPARPVSSGGQGPKTRAFNRNKLAPLTPSMNELAP